VINTLEAENLAADHTGREMTTTQINDDRRSRCRKNSREFIAMTDQIVACQS